ncbi:hypothetical protein PHLGIDRAFT_17457 [Phlebiopsis gigantea 11061_1 CR5-6]|uniref:Uncharacterized protein n=1 Tax=Phlebiopsis gigantea (strain 11061_1 CR5-6) TaxID=745531 RepID=A0A0C3S111_PHLG1|nr:hypothetical protein PHLGIDRAFT_17457 [Phlebiopsis gigantea 11061_1 CR5-6]
MPRLWWLDRQKWTAMEFRGDRVELSSLHDMFQGLEDDMMSLWSNELWLKTSLNIPFTGFVEDLSCKASGYSFLTDPRNNLSQFQTAFISHIQNTPHLVEHFTRDYNSARRWYAPALARWLNSYARLSLLFLLRCEFLSGGPTRGTELTAMQFCSTAEQPQRNLVFVDGQLVLLGTYSKTSANMGHDKLIPHVVDGFAAPLLAIDLIVLRPFAAYVANFLYPDNAALPKIYHSKLFLRTDRLLTTEDLSSAIKTYSNAYMGIQLTINPWRHISIAFRRKLCTVDLTALDENLGDEIAAQQAGHSLQTEAQKYGLSPDALAGPAEDLLDLYLESSKSWQKQMHVVPGKHSV